MSKQKFNSFRDVLNDPKCEYFIVEEIQELFKSQIELLKDYPETARLKNTAYNNLQARDLLNAEGIKREMELIDKKESKLSSIDRMLIMKIVWNAMAETIEYYR